MFRIWFFITCLLFTFIISINSALTSSPAHALTGIVNKPLLKETLTASATAVTCAKDITPPPGTWDQIQAVTHHNGAIYFSFKEDFHDTLYRTEGDHPLTEVTPTGTWAGIDHLTSNLGHLYFNLRDDSYSNYFYVLNEASGWTDLTPPGNWTGIGTAFLTNNNGQLYFKFRDADGRHLYHTSNGLAPTDITPPAPGMTSSS